MQKPLPILIIEDDAIICRALSRALRLGGYRHESVATCAGAARLVGRYSTAIVDVHLPDGNGLDLFISLKERGLLKCATFFSATTQPEEIARARSLGAYVAKADGVDLAVRTALGQIEDLAPPESETRPSTPQLPVAKTIHEA